MFRRAFLLLLVSATFSGPAAATESALSLRWALGAWSSDGESPEALLRDTPLEPGTRLKFLVEPMAPSKIYLLLWDTDENVHVLYRHDGDDRPTYIPPGEDYFEVDDAVGVDTFFLLASAEPLAELDRLLDRYEVAVGQTERVALGQQIVGEIRKQHKAHRDFARAVEKPVMIGGATREVPRSIIDAIDRLAIEVASDGFYSKTISIDHRLERGAR